MAGRVEAVRIDLAGVIQPRPGETFELGRAPPAREQRRRPDRGAVSVADRGASQLSGVRELCRGLGCSTSRIRMAADPRRAGSPRRRPEPALRPTAAGLLALRA